MQLDHCSVVEARGIFEFSHHKPVNEFTEFGEFLLDTDGATATCVKILCTIEENLLFLVHHLSHVQLESHM